MRYSLILTIGVILLISCTGSNDIEFLKNLSNNSDIIYDDINVSIDYCEIDGDCVPLPGCHPSSCINVKYRNESSKPEICTMEFRCDAAYSPQDCACIKNVCTNKKFNSTC